MMAKKNEPLPEGFALRGGYNKNLPYDRTSILFARGIAEVPATNGLPPDEAQLLHRRQISKKNADLDGTASRLDSMTRVLFAREVVGEWLTPRLVASLMRRVWRDANADAKGVFEIVVTPPIKASFNHNVNMLCYVYAAVLCERLQAEMDVVGQGELYRFKVGLNLHLTEYGGTRTESGALGRLARQSVQMCMDKPGTNILLVDDHAEACSVLAVGYDAIAKAGGNVVGISTVSAIPDAKNIRILPQVQEALARLAGNTAALNAALYPAGLRLDTLTNREALLVYGFLHPAATLEQAPEFRQLLEAVGYDFSVIEGQYGTIWEALAHPQMSLTELGDRIYAEATGSRIHLLLPGQKLGWRPPVTADDFLTDLAAGSPKYFVMAPGFVSFDT